LIFSLLLTTAMAGPLAEGYKGLKWGEYKTFPAPTEDCLKGAESGIEWICAQSIGDVPVEAAYAYKHGIFYAVVITGKDFLTCSTLMDTFDVGWGKSLPQSKYATGKMDKRAWRDRNVFASWVYNEYDKRCDIYLINNSLMAKVENIEKAKAAKGAKDL